MRLSSWIICGLFTCAFTACSQSEGEVCQKDSDCDDGLVCNNADDVVRGYCQNPADREKTPDAGKDAGQGGINDPDASLDASLDAGNTADGGDAGAMDAMTDDDAG